MFDFEAYIKTTQDEDNLRIRAQVTCNQFSALSNKLVQSDLENELVNSRFFKEIKGSRTLNITEVEKWLKNSWNTENVLSGNKIVIENTGQSFAMQWAFAQAYYTTFGSLLAHFKSVGYTETSHSAVLKKLGKLMEENKLPSSMSFYTTGGKNNIQYVNITRAQNIGVLELDLKREETVNNQICQFLKATRVLKLIDKAPQLKFKTKKNKPKASLNHSNWEQVSNAIGHTTIMDLLYRKRIKANYEDIDTFNYSGFKGAEVLECLCNITNRLNLVNECFVAKSIGFEQYKVILDSHIKKVSTTIAGARLQTVVAIVGAVN